MDKKAKKCQNIQEVREEIDKIDAQLLEWLALRSNYVFQAASFKKNKDEVKAPGRVEEVIAKIRQQAFVKGLNQDLAEALWREMINQFISIEMGHLKTI